MIFSKQTFLTHCTPSYQLRFFIIIKLKRLRELTKMNEDLKNMENSEKEK